MQMGEKKPWKENLWIEIIYKQRTRTQKGKRHKENILRYIDNFSADLKTKSGLYTMKINCHVRNKGNKKK